MLLHLTIDNYALIDHLDIDFAGGLSVITGETGAGKSIILGALSLILGQRADAKSLKHADRKAVVEGIFSIRNYRMKEFFAAQDWDYDEGQCLIRRELLPSGKSRAFVNDVPTTLGQLKELSERLIDIHSQHQNQLLAQPEYQLTVVDTLAESSSILAQYEGAYNRWQRSTDDLRRLEAQSLKDNGEIEFLRFRFAQLEDARLESGEEDPLRDELRLLENAEEIKRGLYESSALFDQDTYGILPALKQASTLLQSVVPYYPAAEEFYQRLYSNWIDLRDLASELADQAEEVELNPERLAHINERLSLLYDLQKRFQAPTVEALIEQRDELDRRLGMIGYSDEELTAKQQEVDVLRAEMIRLGESLTELRRSAVDRIAAQVADRVRVLGMPHVRMQIELHPYDQPSLCGNERVEFLFAANKNMPLRTIGETASGGEISRLMLAVKSLIAGIVELPTVIFDEIDTGLSGEMAHRMGTILEQMGDRMQVICITHLPQIACKGGNHYKVYKQDDELQTTTHLAHLTHEERIGEVARLISGAGITETALIGARELLSSSSTLNNLE